MTNHKTDPVWTQFKLWLWHTWSEVFLHWQNRQYKCSSLHNKQEEKILGHFLSVKTTHQGLSVKVKEQSKPLTWWWTWRWWGRLSGSDVSGWCRHQQLCSSPVCLLPCGLQSLCALGWGAVGVGGGDVLPMGCGDSQSPRAGVCLQGGDMCGVSHPSWGALSLAGWHLRSWVCCAGLQGKGGGCGGGHSVQNGGLCRWPRSGVAGGATEPGGRGNRNGRCGDVGGGGSDFKSIFLSCMRSVKENINQSWMIQTKNL